MVDPLRAAPWGFGSARVRRGRHGVWGDGEPRPTARGEVAEPSLYLPCTGTKAGFHCVA